MNNIPAKLSLTAVAALILSGNIAFAEEAGNGSELDTVVVAEASDSTSTEKTKSYTTSAMKTTTGLELSPKDTPQSVSVVTKQQLDDRAITDMTEAMRTITGINVVYGSGDNRVRFQSRGFYIDQIEEDGIATTVGGSSGNSMRDPQSMTDLAIYDHIEVVRGATGLTQANGEPGGTINAVRKRPTAETQLQGDFLFDRFGKARTTADISGSLNQNRSVRGRLITALEHNPTFKGTKNNLGLVYGVTEFDIGDYSRLTLGAMFQRKRETPDLYGIPMAVSGTDANLPYDTYLGYNWSKAVFKKTNLFADYETFLTESWKLTAKINYIKNNSDSKTGQIYNSSSTYQGLTPGGTLNGSWLSRYKNEGEQFGVQLNLNGTYELFGQTHDLFLAYAYSYEDSNSTRRQFDALGGTSSSAIFSANPFGFTGGEINEPNWEQGSYLYEMFYNTKIISNALMLGTRFNITDKWHIIAGTRYTNWHLTAYDDYSWYNGAIDNDPTAYADRKRSRFIPYFGLTYDITPEQSLYASYTSIFKPNSGKNRDGAYLPPVIGHNIELGWKAQWFANTLNTAIAVFDIEHKNRTASVQDPTSGGWYNEAVGHVRSRGIDAEISGNLTDNLKLFAGYTFNISKYVKSDNPRNILYTAGANYSLHTPKHIFRLYSSYNLPFDDKKWTIGAGVNFQSETNSLGNIHQGSYAILNANIQYAVSKNITLHLIGSNLTDKRYYENNRTRYNGINNFYGEPLNVMFKLDWKF